jgi:hypothetical protein
MARYASMAGRSARDIQFENAVNYRKEKADADVLNPGMPNVLVDPGWDAYYGGLERAQQTAADNGMSFRVQSAGLGAPAPGGGGPYSPADAQTIAANERLGADTDRFRLGQAAIGQAEAQKQAMIDASAERNRADIAATSDRAAIDNAMSPARPIVQATGRPGDTPTFADGQAPGAPTRAQILAALPGHLQPSVAAYFNQQDAASLANASTAAKANLENAQAQAARAKAQTEAGTTLPQGVTGAAVLQALPPNTAGIVKSLTEGRMPFPSAMALKTPYWQGILEAAQAYDPSFDTAQASNNARVKVRQDFTSGKSAQSINAINTAIGHLTSLAGIGDKLDNSSVDWYNSLKNSLTPGGTDRGVNLNDFNTLKNGVTSELTRVWRGAGGSEQDIKDWSKTIGDAKSKDELRSAFGTIGGMLESKLGALQDQYNQGMGSAAPINVISPQARQQLNGLQGLAGQQQAQQRPIPGVPGGVAEMRDGKWVRVK